VARISGISLSTSSRSNFSTKASSRGGELRDVRLKDYAQPFADFVADSAAMRLVEQQICSAELRHGPPRRLFNIIAISEV
jgi:hypothetical protein